ncbi:MAG: excinuclease ABC subunit UvrC [Prevotellaceae bacterium]|jgi:excinuclease ABC subunit C|nr:excinuclease ABC subunit UvrC [Prevotellaceae bacterium]
MIAKSIVDKVAQLPHLPGVYRFLNAAGTVIYVGKAKDLRKRVAQYFTARRYESRKLTLLVSKIADIRHTVVPTEADALLLENNLIKELQPRYNVLLKDGKTYPWICIKNEPFPRVFSTRRMVRDGSKYFGPYTSGIVIKTMLDLIRHLYPLRTCNLALTPEVIAKGKHRVCLEYHIGRCAAPCTGMQTEGDYLANINAITSIIKGHLTEVSEMLRNSMFSAAAEHKFEEAQRFKDRLDVLKHYRSKSVIVTPSITNVDVFMIIVDQYEAYCSFLRVVQGAVNQSHTVELRLGIEEEKEALLSYFIAEMHERLGELSNELIVPFKPDHELSGAVYTVPQKGDKLKLLELGERNCRLHKLEKLKQLEKTNPEHHAERILTTIKTDLRLPDLPRHIECFDNSNLQGTNAVSSCVVFRNAKPSKKDYRHFNVKTVVGANDFATMVEVVTRRYSRMLTEGAALPQLIVIDGGKGQLRAAFEALQTLGIEKEIAIIGLAKRLEEIYFPGDSIPLFLDKNSESLRVIMQLRDEAHRFGITHHRRKRSASMIVTELTDIGGIGEKTAEKLLTAFHSVARIKTAPFEALKAVVGEKAARAVGAYFDVAD